MIIINIKTIIKIIKKYIYIIAVSRIRDFLKLSYRRIRIVSDTIPVPVSMQHSK